MERGKRWDFISEGIGEVAVELGMNGARRLPSGE